MGNRPSPAPAEPESPASTADELARALRRSEQRRAEQRLLGDEVLAEAVTRRTEPGLGSKLPPSPAVEPIPSVGGKTVGGRTERRLDTPASRAGQVVDSAPPAAWVPARTDSSQAAALAAPAPSASGQEAPPPVPIAPDPAKRKLMLIVLAGLSVVAPVILVMILSSRNPGPSEGERSAGDAPTSRASSEAPTAPILSATSDAPAPSAAPVPTHEPTQEPTAKASAEPPAPKTSTPPAKSSRPQSTGGVAPDGVIPFKERKR